MMFQGLQGVPALLQGPAGQSALRPSLRLPPQLGPLPPPPFWPVPRILPETGPQNRHDFNALQKKQNIHRFQINLQV